MKNYDSETKVKSNFVSLFIKERTNMAERKRKMAKRETKNEPEERKLKRKKKKKNEMKANGNK